MASTSTEVTVSIRTYRGWVVTVAAALTGLVFVFLYVWSAVRAGIPASWGWSRVDMALPYSTMCACFAVTMIPAGRLRDRFGPRLAILLGGLLAGLGRVASGLGGPSLAAYMVGFGVLTGTGVGFGCAATTPAAIKWFPPRRTGPVAGIVVAGFGLAPVVLAPLTALLLDVFASTGADGAVVKGVPATMVTLGVITWVVVGVRALFVRNPPEGHLVQPPSGAGAAARPPRPEADPREMLRTAQFWPLFAMYFFAAAAGLTFISVASDLGKHALGSLAFLVVVVLAAGNASGRIVTGMLSDRIGRQSSLLIEFVWRALVVARLYKFGDGDTGWAPILAVVFMLGFNYGTTLAVFPATCKDYFGIRNFGLNYGWLFAAFGSAGVAMPWLSGLIIDRTGSADLSCAIIIGLLLAAAVLAVVSRAVGQPGMRRGGVPCISREVVRDAAQLSGVAKGILQATLDEPPRFWEKTPGRMPAHLNLVRRALLRRADGGDFVCHGYAGHLLLSSIAHVLRVRVIAGEAYRVRAARDDFGMTEKQAVQYLKTVDAQLRKWTKFLHGVDRQDPALYDVVLRVDKVGVEGVAHTIVAMTELEPFRPSAESREAFTDLLLSGNVWAALIADPRTRAANVRVAADGGNVLVTGSADSSKTLAEIDEVAGGVPGVLRVDNQVGVGGHWQW